MAERTRTADLLRIFLMVLGGMTVSDGIKLLNVLPEDAPTLILFGLIAFMIGLKVW